MNDPGFVLGKARKARGLFESEDWQPCRETTGLTVALFDEVFRFAAENISLQPLENTTPFLTEDYRIMRIGLPNVLELWIFFRIEPDDNNCTLLWMVPRGVRVG